MAIILAVVVGVPLLACMAVLLLLPRFDLAPYVSAKASSALGREVSIASLRVVPGRLLGVEIRGARLANIAGGSQPAMVELERLSAKVEIWPLLRGVVVVRQAEVDGFSLLLERSQDRRANWHFGDTDTRAASASEVQAARGRTPVMLDLRMTRSAVVFRTTGGNALRGQLDTASARAAGADQPITLAIAGAYNDVALTLEGELGSYTALRAAGTPFPMTLRAASGETTLVFQGTSTDPLNADGMEGTLALHAPTPDALAEMAGVDAAPPVPLDLTGKAVRNGDVWRLTDATGALDDAPFTGTLLQLTEGQAGKPDAVAMNLDFTRLNVDHLLVVPREGGSEGMPLRVVALPDPLLKLELAARALVYGRLNATDARLKAELVPGRIVIETLSLLGFGARLDASAELVPKEQGASIRADIKLMDGKIDTLRRAFGLGPLPIAGQVEGQIVMVSEGTMLNDAVRAAHISAVLGITGGTVQREVIEKASTDVRALFRTARGTTQLSCALGVVDIRAGKGEAAPLRLRAGTGTISGIARFDLNRRQIDLLIGSQSETTNFFALDIPIRVSGSFSDPDIAPADSSDEIRGRLNAADTVAALPAALRDLAQRNACYTGRTRQP